MKTKRICPRCRERERHYNSGYCLECRRSYDRARGSKPERRQSLRRAFAKWWKRNGQDTRDRHQKWMTENADRQRKHRRNWRDKNKATAIALVHAWRVANPERVRKINNDRREREINAGGSFTADDIAMKLSEQCNYCFWCSDDMEDKPTIDHFIPLARGGSNCPDNIVMACSWCNCSKGSKMPDEFRIYLQKRRPKP